MDRLVGSDRIECATSPVQDGGCPRHHGHLERHLGPVARVSAVLNSPFSSDDLIRRWYDTYCTHNSTSRAGGVVRPSPLHRDRRPAFHLATLTPCSAGVHEDPRSPPR